MVDLDPEMKKKLKKSREKKEDEGEKRFKEVDLESLASEFNFKDSKVKDEIQPYRKFKVGSFNYGKKIDTSNISSRTARVLSNDKDISIVVAKNMEEVRQLQSAVEYKLASENTYGFRRFLLNFSYRVPVVKKLSKQNSVTELLLAQADIMDKNVGLLKKAVGDYLGLIDTLEAYERELSSRSLEIASYITSLTKHKEKFLRTLKEHQSKKNISGDLSYRERWVLAQKYLLRDLQEIDKEIRKAIHYRSLWVKQSSAIDVNIRHMQLYGEFSEHIAITGEEASNFLRVTAGNYENSARMGDLNVSIGNRLMAWSAITYKLGEAGAKRLYASVALVKGLHSADDASNSNLEKLLTNSTREVKEVLNVIQSGEQDNIENYLRQAENTSYIDGSSQSFIDVGDRNIGDNKKEIYDSFGIDIDLE